MKHTVKTILFIGLALIALFGMTACPNAAGGNTGGNSGGGSSGGTTIPQINLDEQWVNDTVNKASVTPTVIVGTGKKITLSGADLTWTSDNTVVINVTNAASGQYDVTPPEGKADVKLRAKAVKGSYSKERVFTVVVSKEGAGLTAAELIESFVLPSETETDLDLPATIAGVAGTSITWESDKPSVIGADGRITHTERDLRNKDVKLTAKLTYNAQQAQKTFTVALKRLTKIENTNTDGSQTWIFTDSQITYTNVDTHGSNTYKYGKIYTYKDLKTEAKTFTAHLTHVMIDGKWYEIRSAELKAIFMQQVPGATEADYTATINEATRPKLYEYRIYYGSINPGQPETYWFEARGMYDNSKKWFEQNGFYSYSNPSPPNEFIKFRCYGTDLVFCDYKNKEYKGSLNAEGTVFTGTEQVEPGETGSSITVNINSVDNTNKTILITVENTQYTLTFKGALLF